MVDPTGAEHKGQKVSAVRARVGGNACRPQVLTRCGEFCLRADRLSSLRPAATGLVVGWSSLQAKPRWRLDYALLVRGYTVAGPDEFDDPDYGASLAAVVGADGSLLAACWRPRHAASSRGRRS